MVSLLSITSSLMISWNHRSYMYSSYIIVVFMIWMSAIHCCYTQISSSTCDKILNIYVFPHSQILKWNPWSICQTCIQKPSTASTLKLRSGTFFSTAWVVLKIGGGTSFSLCLKSSSALAPLCHQGVGVVPLIKSEKERLHESSRSKSSW